MFSRLPESNAARQRRPGGLVVSTAVHVFLIALAVRATMLTAAPSPKVTPLPIIFADPRVRAPATPAPSVPRRVNSDNSVPTAPVPRVPTPDIFNVVPSTLPPRGAMDDLLRGSDFGPTGLASSQDSASGPPNVADGAPLLPAPFVDKVVVAIPGTGTPRYPSMLQAAGVEGDVRAQFVVDTLGRVERGSVRVLDATHDQFALAVRDALDRARFKPAEAGGRKVRQLAEQTFTFRLGTRE